MPITILHVRTRCSRCICHSLDGMHGLRSFFCRGNLKINTETVKARRAAIRLGCVGCSCWPCWYDELPATYHIFSSSYVWHRGRYQSTPIYWEGTKGTMMEEYSEYELQQLDRDQKKARSLRKKLRQIAKVRAWGLDHAPSRPPPANPQ